MSDVIIDTTTAFVDATLAAKRIDFVAQFGLRDFDVEGLRRKVQAAFVQGYMAGRASVPTTDKP